MNAHRPRHLVAEELSDLSNYLESIPERLRASDAMGAYSARLNDLQSELLMSYFYELQQVGEQLEAGELPDEPITSPSLGTQFEERLAKLEVLYKKRLLSETRLESFFDYATFVGTVAAAVTLALPTSATLALAPLATALAAVLGKLLRHEPTRVQKKQAQLDHIRHVRSLVIHAPQHTIDRIATSRYLISVLSSAEDDQKSPRALAR